MWPKIEKLLVLGRELGFLLKNRRALGASTARSKIYLIWSWFTIESCERKLTDTVDEIKFNAIRS